MALAGRKAAPERRPSPIGQSMQSRGGVLVVEVGSGSNRRCCGPWRSDASSAAMMLRIAGISGADTKVTVGAGALRGAVRWRLCG